MPDVPEPAADERADESDEADVGMPTRLLLLLWMLLLLLLELLDEDDDDSDDDIDIDDGFGDLEFVDVFKGWWLVFVLVIF